MADLLVARNLSKRFPNGVQAVDDVSLTVGAGQIVGLVGESGCGKSTTLRMLLRLATPDSGTIEFAGADLLTVPRRRLRELRARLQFVPQNPQTSFNPRMTVGESIVFNLRAHDWSRTAIGPRVEHLLDRVGIAASFARRHPHELSGGQLQRVAIARALATDPDLVICDEAVSALDKSVQAQILNLLADLQRDTGISVLFVSHDLTVIEHISDHVLVMYRGQVVEEGTPAKIWHAADHEYTRRLIAAIPGLG